ncbi:hypothetical protein [Pontixanthobacter sp. CEM42]|uniref:hypothetical protein n=1 Tax=Pontixanthobacter sp. CEM42 TaxID=2792077 RepID=UPI001ADFA655|nr:hypothetical protein [Pontixanthobacter sp. CEM42]
MIDYFALALTHGLILIALIRIAGRPELDREPSADPKRARPSNGTSAESASDDD